MPNLRTDWIVKVDQLFEETLLQTPKQISRKTRHSRETDDAGTQRKPKADNTKKNMPRHTIVKLLKAKHQQKILKQKGKKAKTLYIQGNN